MYHKYKKITARAIVKVISATVLKHKTEFQPVIWYSLYLKPTS